MYSLQKFESETLSLVIGGDVRLLGRKALEMKVAQDRYAELGEAALLKMANHNRPFDGHFEHDIFCAWVDSGSDISFREFLMDRACLSTRSDEIEEPVITHQEAA